jgi:hypothetical protein
MLTDPISLLQCLLYCIYDLRLLVWALGKFEPELLGQVCSSTSLFHHPRSSSHRLEGAWVPSKSRTLESRREVRFGDLPVASSL